eukprot:3247679-Rhodomonas_salina.1
MHREHTHRHTTSTVYTCYTGHCNNRNSTYTAFPLAPQPAPQPNTGWGASDLAGPQRVDAAE